MSSTDETPRTREEHPVGATVTTKHQTTPVQEEDVASSDEGSPRRDSNQSAVSENDVSGNDGSESEGDTEDGTSKQETLHKLGRRWSGYSMSVTTPSRIKSVAGAVSCSRCNTPECKHILPRQDLYKRNQRAELSETVFRPNESITTTRTGRVVKPVRRLLESMSMVIGESGSKEPLAALFKVLSTFVEV